MLAELPGPDVLRSSAEVVAYAGLNPRQHQSGTSIDRATRISKIGNAVLRAALYMPALSAMRYNSAIVALVTRLKSRGRLKTQTDCRGCDAQAFGAVLRCAENRQTFRCGDSNGRLSHIKELIAWRPPTHASLKTA